MSRRGLAQLDHLPALTAARLAWSEPGADPTAHRRMQEQVRKEMPLLARALDRAEKHAQESYKAKGRFFR